MAKNGKISTVSSGKYVDARIPANSTKAVTAERNWIEWGQPTVPISVRTTRRVPLEGPLQSALSLVCLIIVSFFLAPTVFVLLSELVLAKIGISFGKDFECYT